MTRKQRRKMKRLIRHSLRIFMIIIPFIVLIGITVGMIEHHKKQTTISDIHPETKPEEKEPEPITASILSAGDVIMHDPFLTSSYYKQEDGTFDYNAIFKYIKATYTNADFTVINLESTISDGNYKGYPRFRAPSAITAALAKSNTDLCLLANNHIYDNYDAGMNMTVNAVQSNAMLHMGVRKSTTEKTYLIQDINGIKVGFFNYVYDTGKSGNSMKSINSIPVSNTSAPLINTFNYGNLQSFYSEMRTALEEMKNAGVEYTIAYIHWGAEYQTTENSRQREIAANLCEMGIDALIGGHPHVIQPVDLLTNSAGNHRMLCVYSLGNHLSNQYKERMVTTKPTGHTEDGLMVKLVLQKDKDNTVSLTKVDFIPTWVYRTPDVPDTDNPEFFIMPLDDPSSIIKKAGSLNIETDVKESLERTNAIIGSGVEKVKAALPIIKK